MKMKKQFSLLVLILLLGVPAIAHAVRFEGKVCKGYRGDTLTCIGHHHYSWTWKGNYGGTNATIGIRITGPYEVSLSWNGVNYGRFKASLNDGHSGTENWGFRTWAVSRFNVYIKGYTYGVVVEEYYNYASGDFVQVWLDGVVVNHWHKYYLGQKWPVW